MKFYVDYFGCRSNQAEIQECIIELENSGYRLTQHVNDADFGILNTCCVTAKAERDVHKFLKKVYNRTNIKWFITGCMVSKEEKDLKTRYKNYLFLDNLEKKNLLHLAKENFPIHQNIIFHSAFRSRIFLKIQDGCNFRCSFCIVPYLRGKSVSVPLDQVVERARYLSSLGYREIILTGINLSSYGYDLFPRENLLNVVKRIAAIDGIDFIRLSSLDPRFIKYHFIRELSNIDKVADSFHFSFQSGSTPMLRKMKRGNKTLEYKKILDDFVKYFPAANYGADIIVGFPGEEVKEFNETLEFVKETPLNYLHIFPFSPREGTKAALMDPLPALVVKKRVRELQELNRSMKLEYRDRFLNRELEGILIEEKENQALVITKNFLSVRVPPVRGFRKRRVKVKIKRILNETICEGILIEK